MTEYRCKTCHKVCAYIKAGSRIAAGVTWQCRACADAERSVDLPEFLRGFMKGKK
jgi:RNase P subunit RPR2